MKHEQTLAQGEALFAEDDVVGARAVFESILREVPEHPEALNNLGALTFMGGAVKEAITILRRACVAAPGAADPVINLAAALESTGQLAAALPEIARTLTYDHTVTPLVDLLLKIATAPVDKTGRKKRVAFLCLPRADTFIRPIAQVLSGVYDTQLHIIERGDQVVAPAQWADVVWLEWADNLAAEFTKKIKLGPDKQLICRVHSYEAVDGVVQGVHWPVVDKAIFVAHHILKITRDLAPSFAKVKGVYLVPNGIDLSKFAFIDRPRGKKIAFLCTVDHKKGPMLLLHAFAALVKQDPEFELHIGGTYRDRRYALYLEQMSEALGVAGKIFHHGWIDDVPTFLADKHYIVCSSVLEGHPVGMSEGMARGLKPLIHDFVGAQGVFPREHIWQTIDEFVEMATSEDYRPAAYRDLITTQYSLDRQITALVAAIEAKPKTCPWLDFSVAHHAEDPARLS